MSEPDVLMGIHNTLAQIARDVAEMNKSHAVLAEKVINACKEQDELKDAVFGNGHTGLKADFNEHITRHDERGKMWKALATVGSVTGLSGLLTAVFNK